MISAILLNLPTSGIFPMRIIWNRRSGWTLTLVTTIWRPIPRRNPHYRSGTILFP